MDTPAILCYITSEGNIVMKKTIAKVTMPVPAGVYPTAKMEAQWVRRFQLSAMSIFRKMLLSVPDWQAFQQKIADVSQEAWDGFIHPLFISKRGHTARDISNLRIENLKDEKAYKKWLLKVTHAFETVGGVEAKRFKEKIERTAHLWVKGVIKSTMRFSGDKVRGRGVTAIAGYFLAGDKRTVGMLPPGAQITNGGPIDVTRRGLKSALKAGLVPKLVQAGTMISSAKYDAAVVLEQNTEINEIIKSVQDPAYAEFKPVVSDDNSYCLYIVEGANMWLEIQVVRL
jgi:hypothetical protein